MLGARTSQLPSLLNAAAKLLNQWRQREGNFGGDAEGIKEQLQGIKRVSFSLDDNVGAIDSVVESLRSLCKTAELGLNESLCENDDNCG